MKQQRLKDRTENRTNFKRLENKLDDYAKIILDHLKGLHQSVKMQEISEDIKQS